MMRLIGGIKQGAVIVAACAAATLLACVTTPESEQAEASSSDAEASLYGAQELDGMSVESLEGETRIALVGLEQPVYTVEPAAAGSAVIVELAGVRQPSSSLFGALSGAGSQVSVYDGVVDMVSASTFEGDGMPVTRIEVALAVPADVEVQSAADGLALVVRAGGALAAIDSADAEGVETAIEGLAADEEDPWAVAEAIAGVEESEAIATGGEAEESTWSEESQTAAAVVEPRSSEPATTLRGISVETALAGVLVHLEADGMLASAEAFTIEDPARLVVDLPGIESAVTTNKISVESAWVSGVRLGVHPDKLRVVLDGGPSVEGFQGRRVLPAADGLIMTVGAGADLEEALAARVSAGNGPVPTAAAPAAMGGAAEIALVDEPVGVEDADAMDDSAGMALEEALEALRATPSGDQTAEEALFAEADEIAEEPAAELEPESPIEEEAAWDAMVEDEAVPAALAQAEGVRAPAEIFGLQVDRDGERDRIAVLADKVVDYEVYTPDDETVVVRIEHAVMSNDVGEKITPDAGGPVSLVTTFQQPDVDGDEVSVVVRRAAGLEPQVTRRGSLLFLDFPNTGVGGGGAPPRPPPRGVPEAVVEPEDYANAIEIIEPDGGGDSLSIDGDAMTDLSEAEALALPPADEEPYADLPEFEEPAALHDAASMIDDVPVPMPLADGGDPTPASLEGPAAVDMLEEGGLIDGKKYSGRRISLDFKDVLIADVLRLIAEVSDLNIIAGDEVQGTVTIRLVDVPWDQALDVILLTKGLGFVRVGNVLRIAPSEILKVEEEVRLQERRNKEKLEDLEVKLQPVNYASVEDVSSLVKRLLSPRGTVNTDQRTNTLIIKDISSVIDEATALIQAIDTQTPQVLIEAKIVEANLEFGRELGSTWDIGSQPWVDGFAPGVPRTDLGGRDFKFQDVNNVSIGNPITSVATGTVNFGAFLLDDKMEVNVHIEAMERAGDGKVISSPRVVTLDNREAIIEQGVSIPFQTFEGGDAKLEFIDAVLSLKVTPHITTDKSIIMNLEVTRNAPDASVSTPTGSPAIAKNQAKTETLIKDGQTLVIGGIYTIDKTTRESRVPYLHKIPLIGAAFKSRELSDVRKELLIFVTPRVVVNPALASAD